MCDPGITALQTPDQCPEKESCGEDDSNEEAYFGAGGPAGPGVAAAGVVRVTDDIEELVGCISDGYE